ncbi:hypothetical protein [Chryseobacterium gambrini]|uniref:hypothetical protein n=1 Tax=Chryseobacterium gambrini TaxID=373672 RepID=UPI0022F40145|nr:hypothetical protein [Chryseobacterium gambrini]WBX99679.1 hypothetical protein PE065_10580 [Chryseobacterium gambrini]
MVKKLAPIAALSELILEFRRRQSRRRNSKIASAKSGKQLLKNLFKIYEHPQSLSHPFLLELNFFGAKFFFNILNKE